jgi:hypothetical protein
LEAALTQTMVSTGVSPTPCYRDFVPIDVDTVPFDNSNSKKEGVSRTYKGYDGYTPILAYIGAEGYALGGELRNGSQHSQKGTPVFLKKTIKSARKVTDAPLLLRMDSGFDSEENICLCYASATRTDFIIKRNLRREDKSVWLALAMDETEEADIHMPREGKAVYTGSTYRFVKNIEVRIVYEVTPCVPSMPMDSTCWNRTWT